VIEDLKRQNGQYYTQRNTFSHPAFGEWAQRAGLPDVLMIEPFAGAGNIIQMLRDVDLVQDFRAYDIAPAHPDVVLRDSFADYPDDVGVVVTNPPYLAKNSAIRRGLAYPDTPLQDLYLFSLELMLERSEYVAAIVPAAFGTSDLFRDRLTGLVALPYADMFSDTGHPVCLSLFEPVNDRIKIWSGDRLLGVERDLRNTIPMIGPSRLVRFNDPKGALGLMAVDTTQSATIRFCLGNEISTQKIKRSSRTSTRIFIDDFDEGLLPDVILVANRLLNRLRKITSDVTLTPFMGIRKDGRFRRRLDFRTARLILCLALDEVDPR
jgi:hypothetical protein